MTKHEIIKELGIARSTFQYYVYREKIDPLPKGYENMGLGELHNYIVESKKKIRERKFEANKTRKSWPLPPYLERLEKIKKLYPDNWESFA
jgi:hypothetical protein